MILKEIRIQGLGFVGIASAIVIASVKDKVGNPMYNVIGIDLNNENGLKKINLINSGLLPFSCEDSEFKRKLEEAVIQNKNLKATYDYSVYEDADVVIISTNLDVKKNESDYSKPEVLIEGFKRGIEIAAKKINPECLILIESTVPPGTSKLLTENLIKEEFEKRFFKSQPLICHSSERVMPGKNYLSSITDFWRNFSANCEQAKILAESFLKSFVNVDKFPLTYFDDTNATEIAKVLENSYRAINIAFIYEWTLLAEQIGINLFKVVDSIKKRKGTHDNMMKPGFGVGGYCIPKDGLLAQWSINNLFKISNLKLNLTLEAIQINDKMPLHTFDLIKKEIKTIKGKKFLILGASYLPDVADLRNTPSEVLYNRIKKEGGICHISDPYVDNFEGVFDIDDIYSGNNFKDFDVIIFAVRYNSYLNLNPREFIKLVKENVLLVDTFDILDDQKILYFLKEKINVIGVGKGHIKKMKQDLI